MNQPNYERIAQMVKMHEGGMTLTEIAQHFRITKQRVSGLFKTHGHAVHRGMRSIPDSKIREIGDLDAIVEQLKISRVYATYRLRRLGIEPVFKKRGTKPKWTKERVARFYADYAAGMTQIEITEREGIASHYISALFKKYGFPAIKRRKRHAKHELRQNNAANPRPDENRHSPPELGRAEAR